MYYIQRVNGQDKILKWFWTGYSSRCQAHLFECVKNCNPAAFFTLNSFLCVSRMVLHQRTSSHLETTVGSIGVNMGQHPFGMLLTPCKVHSPTNWDFWGQKGVHLNIRKGFLLFVHSVYTLLTTCQCTVHNEYMYTTSSLFSFIRTAQCSATPWWCVWRPLWPSLRRVSQRQALIPTRSASSWTTCAPRLWSTRRSASTQTLWSSRSVPRGCWSSSPAPRSSSRWDYGRKRVSLVWRVGPIVEEGSGVEEGSRVEEGDSEQSQGGGVL